MMNDTVEKSFCDVLRRICVAAEEEEKYMSNEDDTLVDTVNGVPIRKLFISNLAERTTYKNLYALFSKYGNIESCYLKRNQGKNNYAFVTFSNVMDAMKARRDGSRKEIRLHNRDLRVMPADMWHQPDNIESQYYSHARKLHKAESKAPVRDCSQDYLTDDTGTSIHTLNDDCLMHIFLYLPIVDRVRIERVCKRWKAVSQESWCTVKRLDLSHTTWGFSPTSERRKIDTVILRKVLLRCGRFLNDINLSDLTHFLSQSTLTVVSKLCPNLQTIDITALTVSASGIFSLTNNCHDIVKFSIGCSAHACDTYLKQLFKANPKLRYLKLVASTILGNCLVFLASNAIEEIILERCVQIKAVHLQRALVKFECLKSLAIRNCVTSIPAVVMEAIGMHTKTLRNLELSGKFIATAPSDMLHITQLTNLETLNLSHVGAVTNELLIQLACKCLQLRDVDISGCYLVSGVGLTAITTLPKLERLKISYLKLMTVTGLQDMYNLKQLECRRCIFLFDDSVGNLIKCAPQLELLDLSGCVYISNETLKKAVVAANNKTKNVVLKIYVGGTSVDLTTFCEVSPFLQIVNVDLSQKDDRSPLFLVPNGASDDASDD